MDIELSTGIRNLKQYCNRKNYQLLNSLEFEWKILVGHRRKEEKNLLHDISNFLFGMFCTIYMLRIPGNVGCLSFIDFAKRLIETGRRCLQIEIA